MLLLQSYGGICIIAHAHRISFFQNDSSKIFYSLLLVNFSPNQKFNFNNVCVTFYTTILKLHTIYSWAPAEIFQRGAKPPTLWKVDTFLARRTENRPFFGAQRNVVLCTHLLNVLEACSFRSCKQISTNITLVFTDFPISYVHYPVFINFMFYIFSCHGVLYKKIFAYLHIWYCACIYRAAYPNNQPG